MEPYAESGKAATLLQSFDAGHDLSTRPKGVAHLHGGIDEFTRADLENLIASFLLSTVKVPAKVKEMGAWPHGIRGEVLVEEFLGRGAPAEQGEDKETMAIHGGGSRSSSRATSNVRPAGRRPTRHRRTDVIEKDQQTKRVRA